MDYEKEYKEALERAKGLSKKEGLAEGTFLHKEILEVIFPELAESEDERIRKWLYEYIDAHNWRSDYTVSKEKALAYLEKQKELPFVKDVMLGYPGLYFYDGERLHFQGNPAMEEKQKPISFNESYNPDDCEVVMEGNATNLKQKEQKPALRLVGDGLISDPNAHFELEGEQQLAEWALPEDFEEAVYRVANFISPFDNQEELRKTSHHFAEQLLSLAKKELDKPVEWSEEDMEMKRKILKYLSNSCNVFEYEEIENWLNNLRPQPHRKPSDK